MPKHGANKGGLAGSNCERNVKTKKQKTINLDFMEILENMLLSSSMVSLKMRFDSRYEMKLE